MTAAAVAVSTVTWLPRVLGQGTGSGGTAGAALTARSSVVAGRARITYRVATAGVPAAYGTDDITFPGDNRSSSVSGTMLASGPEPSATRAGTERIVAGQVSGYSRVLGRLTWVHWSNPSYANVKIIDSRRLLYVLESVSRFQAAGYQVIGGDRMKVLRATDPGRLTRRALLPVDGAAVSVADGQDDDLTDDLGHRLTLAADRSPGKLSLDCGNGEVCRCGGRSNPPGRAVAPVGSAS